MSAHESYFLKAVGGVLIGVLAGGVDTAIGSTPNTRIVLTTSDSPFNGTLWNQGWWSDRWAQSAHDNYLTGLNVNGAYYRGFFTFDLSNLSDVVSDAWMRIMLFESKSPEPTERLGLFAVTTPARELNSKPGVLRPDILDDLGNGALYATIDVTIGQPMDTILEVQLNKTAVADMNSHRGEFFSIGASLLDVDPALGAQSLFGYSGSDRPGAVPVELVLSIVPEPTGLCLWICGCLMLCVFGRTMR